MRLVERQIYITCTEEIVRGSGLLQVTHPGRGSEGPVFSSRVSEGVESYAYCPQARSADTNVSHLRRSGMKFGFHPARTDGAINYRSVRT